MKASDLKQIFHNELNAQYGKEEVESFFFLSMEHYLNVPRIQLALDSEYTVSKKELDTFFSLLDELKDDKPIQYIFGETEFYGLKFKVNKNVLIPRQETEELVDWIISEYKSHNSKFRILDIGTGSGCIAISLAKHLPNAEVFALDVSTDALEIAKNNAKLNSVDIQYIEADILNAKSFSLDFKDYEFDIIVSNPPYVRHLEKEEIKANVLDYEPHLALFVDDNDPLLFYKSITRFAVNKLKQNGHLYFEINQYLGEETKDLLTESDLTDIELRKDLNGNDRMLKAIKK
ncbi:MAG: peptide chain release factor N(5)-glutamine methyltransferase [Winogradskyella sp.]|uniref:peptide chain release factor N(5)-glutamine methyltransferase n=1 Tax=Winogradskyella sp. TaxID=1883156 RepID=UPI000F3D61E4|nr:MAG: peptide chain release factor N(5)-glutamine methyltransferase [Winogradskyella sp.]